MNIRLSVALAVLLIANCAGETLGGSAIDYESFLAQHDMVWDRMAPMKIGRHGQLQEWLVDWDNPKDQHGHVSHLYGLCPSSQINHRDTPELFDAAWTSLIQRGDAGGWPGAWRGSLPARAWYQAREGSLLLTVKLTVKPDISGCRFD